PVPNALLLILTTATLVRFLETGRDRWAGAFAGAATLLMLTRPRVRAHLARHAARRARADPCVPRPLSRPDAPRNLRILPARPATPLWLGRAERAAAPTMDRGLEPVALPERRGRRLRARHAEPADADLAGMRALRARTGVVTVAGAAGVRLHRDHAALGLPADEPARSGRERSRQVGDRPAAGGAGGDGPQCSAAEVCADAKTAGGYCSYS